MNNLWQKQFTLRAGDFDKYDRIKPSAVLDLFQDAAGQHAEAIGLGFSSMIERGFLWVLVRVKFQIIAAPSRYQDIIVKTWPLKPHRLNYRREYCIEDKNGKALIIGSSEWVIIDSKERKLLAVPDLYPFDSFREDTMFEGKLTKVHDSEITETPHIVNAGFSDLDINDHVNNTKYANYVLDAVNPKTGDVLNDFQIDYRKEVTLGDTLNIHYIRENEMITAKGLNNFGDIMFACKMGFKK